MDDVAGSLRTRFSLHHNTLQIEQGTTTHACSLDDSLPTKVL
jgi:cobalt-zinc-cadmium efflux system protein